MKNYRELAAEILSAVGGKTNIDFVQHCTTRLRFSLQDVNEVKRERLQEMTGVIQIIEMGGQFQVVMGTEVSEVYRELVKYADLDEVSSKRSGEKNTLISNLFDVIAGIFTPLLGAMAGVGILKGLMALLIGLNWLTETSGTYIILHAASDSFFYFLPLILAITAAKKFGADPYVAFAIAGALVYPDLVAIYQTGETLEFLGIPVYLTNYSTSVIPIVLAVYIMSKIQPSLNRVFPSAVKIFFTPLILIILMVPLTLLVFGPFGTFVSEWLGIGYQFVYSNSAPIAGAFVGASWQVLVIFGLHWGMVPVAVNNLSQFGSDTFSAMVTPAIFAQAGATFGVFLKTKQYKIKAIAGSATIAGVFGVTEPAIYGINLPYKRPFLIGCGAGAVGGAIVGLSGASAVSLSVPGLATLPVFLGSGFVLFIVAIVVSFMLATIVTYFFGYDLAKELQENTHNEKSKTVEVENVHIISPCAGALIPLAEVPDEVIASGVIGKGIAIVPIESELASPVSGEITSIFPTKHVIGITTESGVEVLIHIGLETARLDGQFITIHKAVGAKVKAGERLVTLDIDQITKAGYDIISPIVITNADQYAEVFITDQENVTLGERLLTVIIFKN